MQNHIARSVSSRLRERLHALSANGIAKQYHYSNDDIVVNHSNGLKLRTEHFLFILHEGVNLVDPASSHMLVSKIKPCMCVYKPVHSETADCSLNQLLTMLHYINTWVPTVILELIHAR